ncbi:NTP transferase domain-containing protein [Vibrio sp. McD22-P3]|uniref:NTP transferase domain-containing protein n=1 Tax=Vibrio sp. McD22-P3 TaxID=2724880 RepID=UPI001F404F28|nr:NTP transferase domain-containing protein [Vibrio sp. McD22-P3]MCF4174372.1 NTP transferase domain-containing protein [Vibrio sp. McD22-P3]
MIKNKNNIDCVIPAAGLSSRMGCWKLTLPYKDNTILEQSITNALSFCTRVILVVGYREDELIEQFQDNTKVTIVRNQHYRSGMYSSLQLGINEVDTEFFYISHGDMPCIEKEIYKTLWEHKVTGTLFPGEPHATGHPVLIHTASFKAQRDQGNFDSMKSILKLGEMAYLRLCDPTIHLDVDTPEAYQKLLKLTQSKY